MGGRMKRLAVIEVEWIDSHSHHGWVTPEERAQNTDVTGNIHTVGFLIERTKKWVRFSASHDGQNDPNFQSVHSVPTGAITRLRVLRSGRK